MPKEDKAAGSLPARGSVACLEEEALTNSPLLLLLLWRLFSIPLGEEKSLLSARSKDHE